MFNDGPLPKKIQPQHTPLKEQHAGAYRSQASWEPGPSLMSSPQYQNRGIHFTDNNFHRVALYAELELAQITLFTAYYC